MKFEQIIRSFATSETVPVEAIRAAVGAPEAFVDEALPLLQKIAAAKATDQEKDAFCVLVHVLGEIGDARAFRPLMQVLALPRDDIDPLLGDSITESLDRVVISLVGDDASVLEPALCDTGIDEFVRDALFNAWTHLALTGRTPPEKAKPFLADYPVRAGLESYDFGWSSWVDAVTVLGFAEMTDLARENLANKAALGKAPFSVPVTVEDFERALAESMADPERWKEEKKYQPFTDTIAELSGWYGYSEQYREDRARREAREEERRLLSMFDAPYIAVNPHKDVGRNDPCPCGSGKKFKKCCLDRSLAAA